MTGYKERTFKRFIEWNACSLHTFERFTLWNARWNASCRLEVAPKEKPAKLVKVHWISGIQSKFQDAAFQRKCQTQAELNLVPRAELCPLPLRLRRTASAAGAETLSDALGTRLGRAGLRSAHMTQFLRPIILWLTFPDNNWTCERQVFDKFPAVFVYWMKIEHVLFSSN